MILKVNTTSEWLAKYLPIAKSAQYCTWEETQKALTASLSILKMRLKKKKKKMRLKEECQEKLPMRKIKNALHSFPWKYSRDKML